MSELQVYQFLSRTDNYGLLVHDPISGDTASIDAGVATDVEAACKQNDWTLSHIFVTHHHFDHVEGLAELKQKTGCKVIGTAKEADKIGNIDVPVDDGDVFEFGGEPVHVISTPGHTLGMVNFHFPDTGLVFTGDTLFSMGCGRLFEGDAEMMWQSLQKLMALPLDTKIYCGHEYTQANAAFCLTIDPDNAVLSERVDEVNALRAEGQPTVPTTLARELETNVFLRVADPAIRKNLNMEDASDAAVFAEIRARKDKG